MDVLPSVMLEPPDSGARKKHGSELIQPMRKAMQLTMERLGEIIGVTPPVIYRWIRGERRPSIANAVALQMVLGIPVARWLTDTEEKAISERMGAQ